MSNTGRAALALAFSIVLAFPCLADVVTDGTVGAARSLAGPNYAVGADLGRQVGGNLFHSFSRFNLATGEAATFNGPGSVSNIVGRVTGGTASSIDGTIRSTIPGANLFLINPAGLMFGPNARLDVSGAFHASTADYLRFADGSRFLATNPAGSSFTAAPPAAFGFLTANPAAISLNDPQLSPAAGQSLSLVGGNLTIVATQPSFVATTDGGSLNLAAVGAPGEVVLRPGAFDASSIASLSDIAVSGPVFISSQSTNAPPGGTGGALAVRANNLVLDGATILSQNIGAPPGLPVDIGLTGDLVLRNVGSVSSGQSDPAGTGAAGPISIAARNIRVTDSTIQSTNFGAGPAADITLNATGMIDVISSAPGTPSLISASAAGTGRAGNLSIKAQQMQLSGDFARVTSEASLQAGAAGAGVINIEVDRLTLRDGSNISTSSFTAAGGGNIQITASNVLLNGGFLTASSIAGQSGDIIVNIKAGELRIEGGSIRSETTDGRGGQVELNVDRLVLTTNGRTGGDISTTTGGLGNAGDVRITAGSVSLDGGSLISASTVPLDAATLTPSASGAAGNAGTVVILTPSLDMTGGASIVSLTTGLGQAGGIEIHADRVSLDGGAVVSATSQRLDSGGVILRDGAAGDAGNITIDAGTVTLKGGGLVTSNTNSAGRGGQVSVSARNQLDITGASPSGTDPSGLYSRSAGSQPGGRISVNGRTVTLQDRGIITAESRSGTGGAGSIDVAADSLSMRTGAAITTEASSGGGGNIVIRAGRLLEVNNSQITTSVQGGTGNSGNISIDPDFVVLNNGTIRANAVGGNAGNITISTGQFLKSPDSTVEARSQFGLSGTIAIQAPANNVTGSLTELSGKFFDASAVRHEGCAGPARVERQPSSLVAGGRGALPQDADGAQPGTYFAGRDVQSTSKATSKIAEARGRAAPALRISCGG